MARKRRYTIDFIREHLKVHGYSLVSGEFIDNTKVHVECPKGHKSFIYFSNFYVHGHRCLLCSGSI